LIGSKILKLRKLGALAIFIGLTVLWILINAFSEAKELFSLESLNRFFDNLLVATSILLIATDKTIKDIFLLSIMN
jgi:hypothetical protein